MESSVDHEPEEETSAAFKRKSGGRPMFMSNWVVENVFPDEQSAVDCIMAEGIWSIDFQRCYAIQGGRKRHYRCNRMKLNGSRCSVLKCLYFPRESTDVFMYKMVKKHKHNKDTPPHVTATRGLLENGQPRKKFYRPMESDLKIRIVKLMKEVQSPKEVIQALQIEGFDVSNREIQIRNYLSSYKRQKQKSVSKWVFEKTFNQIEEAKLYLKLQKIWNFNFQNRSRFGIRYHYRCKLAPKDGIQCAARKYFSFNKYTNEITLYRKDCPHTHADIMRTAHLDLETKTNWLLKQLYKADRTALLNQRFKVLAGVGLQDCFLDPTQIPTDYGTSFHDKLFMLQQETCADLNYEIKEEVVTDEEDFPALPVEVNLYEGDDANNELLNVCQPKAPKAPRSRKPLFTSDWLFEEKFPNEEMAQAHLAKDNIWHIDPRRVYSVAGGRKVHYRCNRVKINGPQCAAWKCLLYSLDSEEVSLYKKDSEHTHDSIAVEFRKSKVSIKRRMAKQRRKVGMFNNTFGENKPAVKKRGRPLKRKPEGTNGHCSQSFKTDSHISNDSQATSMELITGDDSIQYVINYIDDVQTKNDNRAQTNHVQPEPNANWIYETSFATFEQAQLFLRQFEWTLVSNPILDDQRKTFYRCNMVKQFGPQCGAEGFLLCCPETNTFMFYRNSVSHNHDQLINNSMLPVPQIMPPLHSNNSTEIITDSISDNQLIEMDFQNGSSFNAAGDSCSRFEWRLEDKILMKEMVSSYLNKHNTWRCTHRSGKNSKVHYSCVRQKCDAQMFLVYEKETNQVLVYRCNDHTHPTSLETSESPFQTNTRDMSNDYSNVDTIVKEELIIMDEPMASGHNESGMNEYDYGGEEEQMASAQTWNFERKFANMNEANEFLNESNGLWEIKSTTKQKCFYRCTFPCEPECPANIFFLIDTGCEEVLYFSGDPHIHPPLQQSTSAILPKSQLIDEIVICDSDTEEPVAAIPELKQIETPAPVFNEFALKQKFANLTEALNKMKRETDHWVATYSGPVENGYRKYFFCNYSDILGKCPSRVTILGKHNDPEVLYYTSGLHIHQVNLDESENTTVQIPVKLNECTDEIVISDDSDKDSLNGDELENIRQQWVFETKFDDYKTAKRYMKNLKLLSLKTNISKYGVKEYYNCNVAASNVKHCPASKYLLYQDLTSDVLMYNRNITHANVCTNVIPPLVSIQKRLTSNVIDLVDSDDEIDNKKNQLSQQMPVSMNDSEEDGNTSSTQSLPSVPLIAERSWVLEKEFNTSKEAAEHLKNQRIWSFKTKTLTNDGFKEFYQCNLAKKPLQECLAAKFIQFMHGKKIALYKTLQQHTHDAESAAVHANQTYENLSAATKARIQTLIMAGNRPKQILEKLDLEDFDVSMQKSLCYYLTKIRQSMRRKISNSLQPFMKSIEIWLMQISAVPVDEDSFYCVSFNLDYTNRSFRSFLSTRRLLKNALDTSLVHLDSSYALNWRQNPITIVGTTDLDQNFHLFGVALCSTKNECDYEFMFKAIQKGVQECHQKIFKPECLVTDANEDVRSAFIKTFGISTKIGTCSRVALANINYQLSSSLELSPIKSQIQNDILKLQKLSTQFLFFKAVDLFFRKWRPIAGEKLNIFLNYFKANWIDRNPNWFQGFREFTPHTNRAIASTYEQLARTLQPKQETPLVTFQEYLQKEVENWSRQYVFGGPKQFMQKTTIPVSVYEKAVEWNNLEKQIEIVHRGSEIRYYVSADEKKFICEKKLHKYRVCEHKTLDEFFDIQYSFWFVKRLKNNLTCNCPNFLENYVCCHSVGMASVLNIIKFPPKIDQYLINRKISDDIVHFINSS